MITITLLRIATVAVIMASVCWAVGAGSEVVHFRDNAERCFRLSSGTSTQYIIFKPDGSYSKIAREHMFVKESDRGRWVQADSGEIAMTSALRFRSIEYAPLSIYVGDERAVSNLVAVKQVIGNYLDRHTSDTFTRQEVEGIEKYGYKNYVSRVSVDINKKEVSRQQLQDLLTEIDYYIEDDTKNVFSIVPYRYGTVTYLLWKDEDTPLNRDSDKIEKRIQDSKPDKCPTLVYCQADTDLCHKESSTTQPFIFYPELNTARAPANVSTGTATQNHP